MVDTSQAKTKRLSYAVQFGVILLGAGIVTAAAGHLGGLPGLALGAALVGGAGTVLGRRVDSTHRDVVSSVVATLDDADSVAIDGGIRALDTAFETQATEKRQLRREVDELESPSADSRLTANSARCAAR